MSLPTLSVLSDTSIHTGVLLAVGPLGTRGLIGTLFIGLIVGALAKLLTPGREPRGCIITMAIGVVGSYLALFLGRQLGVYGTGDVPGFLGSLLGAILLLIIYHLLTRRSGGL